MVKIKLITYKSIKSNYTSVGLLKDKKVFDLSPLESPHGTPKTMKHLLEIGLLDFIKKDVNDGFHKISKCPSYSLDDIKILAPISDPQKLICVGLNYRDHASESNMQVPTAPLLFSKFSSSIIGPGDTIIKPKSTSELDYEAELVVVIGKKGKNIPESEAKSYIAGFTVGHDVSARDWQLKKNSGQWLIGKTFDTFAPIGPSIVCDIPDPHNLGIRCILNGNVVQNSNTSYLIFKIDYLVSYISQMFTLVPGDLIFTGTPPGVGLGRKPPLWMKHGDKVTCEIDHIGSLTNEIKDELE